MCFIIHEKYSVERRTKLKNVKDVINKRQYIKYP